MSTKLASKLAASVRGAKQKDEQAAEKAAVVQETAPAAAEDAPVKVAVVAAHEAPESAVGAAFSSRRIWPD